MILYQYTMASSGYSNKYGATWVSHSSMGDFLKCPRAYFLHNVYKDPETGHKINITNPALALGQSVHEVLEGLALLPAEKRFEKSLIDQFQIAWKKVSGKWGGFKSADEEMEVKKRGEAMLARVEAHPEPLKEKALRMKQELPNFYLDEANNIILCGKIDWMQYVPENDSIHILDFKTGKNEEKEDSLQLPIYVLLLNALQKRAVTGASYWYVDKDDAPVEKPLPELANAREQVLAVAREVKKARDTKVFTCPRGAKGCFACKPFEAILAGEAEYVGVGQYNQDLYIL
jgi:ATP-dependent helicase/DNAse subunit B